MLCSVLLIDTDVSDHMSFWYKPSEMPWRIGLFYSIGQVASALNGLLAFAIGYRDGLGHIAGWR